VKPLRAYFRPEPVILSAAPEERIPCLSDGRGVEGPRRCVFCDAASGSSLIRAFRFTIVLALALWASMVLPQGTQNTKPAVQLNVDHATPREVSDTVQQALVRDYSAAWQSLATALADNNAGALNDTFIGYAQDQLTQRIKDQQQAGLRTHIVDRGHNVEAVFYSTEGAAIELRDTATLETQILDGETVIHSERAQVRYYVIMTGAEDRWKVRVMENAPGE
jgi:hypothetical protein